MAKPVRKTYSAAEKSALVAEVERLYRVGGRTYPSIARELGLGDSTYHNWVKRGVKPTAPAIGERVMAAPYTAADRTKLVAHINALRGEGQAIAPACHAVGISPKSYRKWREDAAPTAPFAVMRPVEVTVLVPTAMSFVPTAPPATAPALALFAPGGYRVEGLSVEAAAQLLRALA